MHKSSTKLFYLLSFSFLRCFYLFEFCWLLYDIKGGGGGGGGGLHFTCLLRFLFIYPYTYIQ